MKVKFDRVHIKNMNIRRPPLVIKTWLIYESKGCLCQDNWPCVLYITRYSSLLVYVVFSSTAAIVLNMFNLNSSFAILCGGKPLSVFLLTLTIFLEQVTNKRHFYVLYFVAHLVSAKPV